MAYRGYETMHFSALNEIVYQLRKPRDSATPSVKEGARLVTDLLKQKRLDPSKVVFRTEGYSIGIFDNSTLKQVGMITFNRGKYGVCSSIDNNKTDTVA